MTGRTDRLNALKVTPRHMEADDEFYTRRDDIDAAIECTIRGGMDWRGLTVLCPCDGPASQFPPALEAVGARAVRGCGRFQHDDFAAYDMVATNPPFSSFRGFMKKWEYSRAGLLCVAPVSSLLLPRIFGLVCDGRLRAFATHGTHWVFQGGKTAPCIWLTTCPIAGGYGVSAPPQSMADARPIEIGRGGPVVPGFNRLPAPFDAAPGQTVAMPATVLADASMAGWRPYRIAGNAWQDGRLLFKRILIVKE